jgi:hypothetical protein
MRVKDSRLLKQALCQEALRLLSKKEMTQVALHRPTLETAQAMKIRSPLRTAGERNGQIAGD